MNHLKPNVRTSKRKRAQVTYYDSDSSHEEDDDHESGFSNKASTGTNKKRKINPAKSRASRPLPKRDIFAFMLLPPELRNRIYELTFTAPEDIVLKTKQKSYRRNPIRSKPPSKSFVRHKFPLQPKILQLNKKIYSEAQPILYGRNQFSFENSSGMHCFLATIGTTNVASLTHVILEGYSGRAGGYEKWSSAGMDYPAMVLLAPARQLRVFEIGCSVYTCHEDELQKIARGFYRMAYPWLDARGDDAVEALRLVEITLSHFVVRQIMGSPGPMEAHKVKIFKDTLREVMKSR